MNYDINLRHLEYFVRTARLGSINKAAQLLHISQPYLGKILHDLEVTMGVPLLNRSRQGVSLTPEGRDFLPRAINILKEMDALHFMPAAGENSAESLSVSMTKFSHVMECFIAVVQNHQEQPSFAHRLYEGQMEDVIEDVVSSRADIGVLHFDSKRRQRAEADMTARGLSYRFLSYVEPHIVLSRNHPLIREGKPVTLENLRDYGFVRYLGQYDDLLYNLSKEHHAYGGKPGFSREIYVSGRATLMNLIALTDFYTIGIHDFDQQPSAFNAISVPLTGCELMFEFGYITLEGVPISDIVREFLTGVKERLAKIRP